MRALAITLLLMTAGCTVLGVTAYKVVGPPAVPAKYVPEKKPMLVLVEHFQRQSTSRANADSLARYISDQLEAHNVAPLVPFETLSNFRDSRSDFSTMSITAIGQAVEAEQVLYVQIVKAEVLPVAGGAGMQGETQVRVKVVNVASGETMWPRDLTEGYELSRNTQIEGDRGRDAREVQQRVNVPLADEIAKLFYKWKPVF